MKQVSQFHGSLVISGSFSNSLEFSVDQLIRQVCTEQAQNKPKVTSIIKGLSPVSLQLQQQQQ